MWKVCAHEASKPQFFLWGVHSPDDCESTQENDKWDNNLWDAVVCSLYLPDRSSAPPPLTHRKMYCTKDTNLPHTYHTTHISHTPHNPSCTWTYPPAQVWFAPPLSPANFYLHTYTDFTDSLHLWEGRCIFWSIWFTCKICFQINKKLSASKLSSFYPVAFPLLLVVKLNDTIELDVRCFAFCLICLNLLKHVVITLPHCFHCAVVSQWAHLSMKLRKSYKLCVIKGLL